MSDDTMKPEDIHESPVQREELPENWHKEAVSIYRLIEEVEGGSFEKFEENFRRDANYALEITLWRCIASAYNLFITARVVEPEMEEKKEAFKCAVSASFRSPDAGNISGGEHLSDVDAEFIHRTYHSMIDQTFKNRREGK